MNYVECVYRAGKQGIMLSTKFDLKKNCLKNFPELLMFPFTELYEVDESCYSGSNITIRRMMEVMSTHSDALLALNLNDIVIVLVYEDKHGVYSIKDGNTRSIRELKESIIKLKTRDLGITKTELKTLEFFQPINHLIAFEISGQWYTQYKSSTLSMLPVGIEGCDIKELMSRYLEFCRNEDAKFLCLISGEIRLLNDELNANIIS